MRDSIKARHITAYMYGWVCNGPNLCMPTLQWANFAMGKVCYGPSYRESPKPESDLFIGDMSKDNHSTGPVTRGAI